MLKRVFNGILVLAVSIFCICFTAYADASNLADNIRVVSGDDGFELKFLNNRLDVVDSLDRINIIVLKPNCDFDAIISESDVENSIYIFKNILGNESEDRSLFSYDFPSSVQNDNDIDIYPIKIAVTTAEGEYYEANLQYKKISDDYREKAIKALSTVSKEDFLSVWTNIVAPMFDTSDSENFDKYINLISNHFVLVRNALFAQNNITEFEDLPSIIKCAERAMSLYTLENSDKDTAEKIISEYGIVFEEVYDFSDDFTAFYNLYSGVIDNYRNSENLDYFKKICIMANMQNGLSDRTVEEIANCIRKYSKELKIDLSYATQKNVSINKVSGRIDADNISKYYNNSAWFNDIVDGIYNDEDKGNTSSPSKKGGSSGGGSVSVGNAPIIDPPSRENDKPQDTQVVFGDLNGYEWASDAIKNLYENKVISGDGSGNFFPSRNITREEFVKMICLAFNIYFPAEEGDDIEFEDVSGQDWFYPYVRIAKMNGLVNGKSETLFGTGESITRQDMACMLYNLLIYKGVNIVPENNKFSDNEMISLYSVKAVDTLTSTGIISGFDDNTFRPLESADRGQAAKMIYNMILYLN